MEDKLVIFILFAIFFFFKKKNLSFLLLKTGEYRRILKIEIVNQKKNSIDKWMDEWVNNLNFN